MYVVSLLSVGCHVWCHVVQVWNGAGLTAIYSSLGHTHDSTPPFPGIVYDTLPYMSHNLSHDQDHTSSLSAISAHWSKWSDAHSHIVDYHWAIGTCDHCHDVQDFLSVGVASGEATILCDYDNCRLCLFSLFLISSQLPW